MNDDYLKARCAALEDALTQLTDAIRSGDPEEIQSRYNWAMGQTQKKTPPRRMAPE